MIEIDKINIDKIIGQIQRTLSDAGFKYKESITNFRQCAAMKQRKEGEEKFNMCDHIRGLLYSQLSNQRPWAGIEKNLDKIDKIFMRYNPAKLKAANGEMLACKIKEIKCGNRQIKAQMEHLAENIRMLEFINKEEDGLDRYVVSQDSGKIAKELSAGKYKLQQIGFALATEYLRNVGVDTVKPDLHICRIIGSERLNFIADPEPKPEAAHECLMKLAKKSKHSATYIDNLLWMFAAKDYGEICTKEPKCKKCSVSLCKRYPLSH